MFGILIIYDTNTSKMFSKQYYDRKDMVNMLIKLCYSKHLICISYEINSTYSDNEIQYWFNRQFK